MRLAQTGCRELLILNLLTMIVNNHNLDITQFCGDDTRPEISGVYFNGDKTVATDSFRLIEVQTLPDTLAEDMPDGMASTPMDQIIPADAVKKALRNIPKNPTIICLENVAVSSDNNKNTATLTTSDLETQDQVKSRVIDGTYPDWKRIMPKNKPKQTVTVNAKYLKEMADYFTKHGVNKRVAIAVNEQGPIVFTSKTEQDQVITGLLMPIETGKAA